MTHKVELEWSQHPVELADFMTIRDYFGLQIVSAAGGDLACEFWHFGVSRIKDDLQSNLIDRCTIEGTFGSCANNLAPAWTLDDHEASLIQRRIIAKVGSAFHRAFAMTLSLDNGNKSYKYNVLNTWAGERARLCRREASLVCVIRLTQQCTRNLMKRNVKEKNQNWMKHPASSYWTLNCFPTITLGVVKKLITSYTSVVAFVCCVYRMRRTKNLSIKIERKSVSEGSHTWWKHERRKTEAIEAENEKSFNFQSIIKVVIKRNFSFFPRLFF